MGMIDSFVISEDVLSNQKKFAHLIANTRSGKGKGMTLADEAQIICDELGDKLTHSTPSLKISRYDQNEKKTFSLLRSHSFVRKDKLGWQTAD